MASQILTGQSVLLATRVIICDGDWLPANIQQLSGRVQRNSKVQLAAFTESYRFLLQAIWCGFALWLADRHSSAESVRSEIEKAAATVVQKPIEIE